MKYLLDSNVLITLALDADEAVMVRASECDAEDMVTSAVAFAEVAHGSERGKPPPLDRLAILAEEIPVLAFDESAARAYAAIPFKRASYDRLIAAHALSLGLIVVTHNEKHFADVPGLAVENWAL
jgi:tRNA(fMet)-specific endonuclease VapC